MNMNFIEILTLATLLTQTLCVVIQFIATNRNEIRNAIHTLFDKACDIICAWLEKAHTTVSAWRTLNKKP